MNTTTPHPEPERNYIIRSKSKPDELLVQLEKYTHAAIFTLQSRAKKPALFTEAEAKTFISKYDTENSLEALKIN